MDINVSECFRSIENSFTKAECTDHANETCQGDTADSKGDEDTAEKTGQTKKRYRSEKQKERTRQYKKKIRRAKKQMMREKKLVERKNNDGHLTGGSLSLKPQGPETESPSARLLQTSGNKIEPENTGDHENPQIENVPEQVSAINLTKAEVHLDRYEDKLLDNVKDDSMSLEPQSPEAGCATVQLLSQTEEKIESENFGVDMDLSKENLPEQNSAQVKAGVNLTTQASLDADIDETIIPDNNSEEDSLSLKEFETRCATGALFSQSDDNTESENIGKHMNPSREDLLEPTSVHLIMRPTVNIATEPAVEEARHRDLILVDTADRQDIFGILSVYVHSSIHVDYDKDLMGKAGPANDFGYVYFSMKDFWK